MLRFKEMRNWVLTRQAPFDILSKLSREPRPKRRRANLENDTDKDEKKVRILRVKRHEPRAKRGLWRARAEGFGEWKRIKHQSLILAQDERWRRA